MKTLEQIIEVLNKYSKTDLQWMAQIHGKNCRVIDFMDYYKVASELTEKESEVRTEEEILEKYLQPNFNISNTEIKEYHRFISIEDAIKAMHEFASQLQQPEITDENLIIKIRRILVDYHRRDDYDLTKAENDMLCLFRNTFVSLKEQPSDEADCLDCKYISVMPKLDGKGNIIGRIYSCDKRQIEDNDGNPIRNPLCPKYEKHPNQRILGEYLLAHRTDK